METNATRTTEKQESGFGVRRHCLLLALIGLCAIAVSTLLPSEHETASADSATQAASRAPSKAPIGARKGPAERAVQTPAGAAAAEPFDYFPAQFPVPSGEISEQPATF
jgi:hypothetical protein